MDEREYMGYWWIEEEPNNWIPGTLKYRPTEGIRLQLINDFFTGSPEPGVAAKNIDKILGINESGEWVTLLDCVRDTGPAMGSHYTEVRPSEYLCQFLLEGFAFQSMNPAFDNLSVSFYGIDKWAGLTTPRPGDEFLSDSGNLDHFSVVVDIPDPLSTIQDEVRIELGAGPTVNYERAERGKIDVQHQFRIKPRRAQMPFDYFYNHIDTLRKFVALGLGHPTDPSRLKGEVRTSGGQTQEVGIFYHVQGELERNVSVHPNRMLFRPLDIVESFGKVVDQWYKRSEEINEIYNQYFITVFQDRMYPENRFLSLCNGLESYHRKRFSDTYMAASEYDNVYDDFMELLKGNPSNVYSALEDSDENLQNRHNMPNSFVQSMKDGTIKYANEKSLARRLKEVIAAIDPLLDGLPFSVIGKHRKIANTRNYFAHRTDELRKISASGAELTELIWGLQLLIEACLLLEIGIHPDQIKSRLDSRYKQRWVG